MVPILRNEMEKYFKYRFVVYIICILFCTIILNTIRMISDKSNYGYLELIKQSITSTYLSSGIMALVIPIISIVVVSSIISEDYETGTMKFLLISSSSRIKVLFGKLIAAFFILIIHIIAVFVFVTIISGLMAHNYNGIASKEYFQLLGEYLFISLSIIPIMLGAVLISLYLDRFSKAVTTSVVIFFLFYIIDNLFIGVKYLSITYPVINLMFVSHGVNEMMLQSVIFSLIYSLLILGLNILKIERKDFWI